jgi:hypothetical protein
MTDKGTRVPIDGDEIPARARSAQAHSVAQDNNMLSQFLVTQLLLHDIKPHIIQDLHDLIPNALI